MGIGMILSVLLSRSGRKHPISGIYGGVLGGLFLAAVLTQGFGFIVNISDEFNEFSNAPYRGDAEIHPHNSCYRRHNGT
jgi:hypothetical protein